MKKLLFLSVVFCAFVYAYQPQQGQKVRSAINVSQYSGKPISVGGIACADCVNEVINAIKSVEGVEDVNYDSKNDLFYISMKDGYQFDEVKIKQAIEKAGYSYKGSK
jgi:copper chaperone CopZ